MKRKLTAADAEMSAGRRQPQTSCDFCRLKKLKCDRQRPCSSCVARGRPCRGPPGSHNAPANSLTPDRPGESDVQARLRRLEEAVFGSGRASGPSAIHSHSIDDLDTPERLAACPPSSDQEMADLNCLDAVNPEVATPGPSTSLLFFVESKSLQGGTPFTDSTVVGDDLDDAHGTIWLPCRDDAVAFSEDFLLRGTSHLHIFNGQSVRKTIDSVYAALAQRREIHPGSAALILSMCAMSAFLWHDNVASGFNFGSAAEATRVSQMWLRQAWAILDKAQRCLPPYTLDDIQARMVLSELLYSCEGASRRQRYMHSCTVAIARELRLHMVDAQSRSGQGTLESPATREIKRRIWWHLTSTDWLMGEMGGPWDRTYTIQPHQNLTNRPRNISDQELPFCNDTESYDPLKPTEMTSSLFRIRLAEISRVVIDTMPLGSGSIDSQPFEQISAIDDLVSTAVAAFPERAALKEPEWPPRIAVGLQVPRLAIQARRARLFRVFLNPAVVAQDKRMERFRTACLRSAEDVIEIGTWLLEQSLESVRGTGKPGHSHATHRSGPVINHFFVACAVLATDPALRDGADAGALAVDPQVEARRIALAKACRLLEEAGRCSDLAAGLLRRLLGLLRRHRVQGVGGENRSRQEAEAPGPDQTDKTAEVKPEVAAVAGLAQDNFAQQQGTDYVPEDGGAAFDSVNGDALGGDTAYPVGIWDEFMSAAPMTDGWDNFFADMNTFYSF